jgi:hypothetical protein
MSRSSSVRIPVENDKSSLFSGELFGTIAQDLGFLLDLTEVLVARIGGIAIFARLIDRLRVGELLVKESGQFNVHDRIGQGF